MKQLKKFTLTILAALPVASVSIAAHSQLLDMAGEEQNDRLANELRNAKLMLFQPGSVETTKNAASMRVTEITGFTDQMAVQLEMHRNIKILMEKGLIEFNGNKIVSRIPSW